MFDTITWHTNHVLTSVDIQQRYLEICRRAKKKIVIPEDIRLVEIQDVASGVTGAPLPLFSGQEIETKTGKTVYGSPKLDTGKQTATDIGKETVITAGISSGVIIPQSSAEIPETPRNSAENGTKKKKVKKIPPLSPGLFRRQGMMRTKFHSLRTGIGEMFPQNPAGNVRNMAKNTV